jgi:ComF family protein
MKAVALDLVRGLLQLLYPNVCAVCYQPAPGVDLPFCPACRAALTAEPHPLCPRCACDVGPFALVEGGCARCRNESFHFDRVLRLGAYDSLLRDVVLRMKHYQGEPLAECVGQLWAEHRAAALAAVNADVVIPVPLHWWRRWSRGYNQSAILALALAEGLRRPCRPGWLRRIRNTSRQTLHPATTRRNNVRGAFRASRSAPLRGLTVLLVDDVLTTGSTASEAAGALRQAGAAGVVVAALARASPSNI